MTGPASHTLAYLRRLDDKLDRFHSDVGERFDRIEGRLEGVEGRLGRIEDELLVLNGIALRLEGREVETTGLKAILDRHERGLADLGRRPHRAGRCPERVSKDRRCMCHVAHFCVAFWLKKTLKSPLCVTVLAQKPVESS